MLIIRWSVVGDFVTMSWRLVCLEVLVVGLVMNPAMSTSDACKIVVSGFVNVCSILYMILTINQPVRQIAM